MAGMAAGGVLPEDENYVPCQAVEVMEVEGVDTEEECEVESEELALHQALVAYVRCVDGQEKPTAAELSEHSYARSRVACGGGGARGCGGAGAVRGGAELRTLLVRREPRCRHCRAPEPAPAPLVVDDDPPAPPRLPGEEEEWEEDGEREEDGEWEEEGDGWEERVKAAAPSAEHARLASRALEVVRDARLARLAGAGREAERAGGRRLRQTLAPLWGRGGGGRPVAWLHATLSAHLPPLLRRVYLRLVAEVRRRVPALCERALGPAPPAPAPAAACAPAAAPAHRRPQLLWLPSGSERLDERWERRFRVLLPTRRIHAPDLERTDAERWCGGVLEAARAAVAAAGAEAGARWAVGGAGAGGLLALQLAGAAGVAAVLALAPPLLTAEGEATPGAGERGGDTRVLVAVGEASAQCTWAAANEWARGSGGGGGETRLLLVGGADDALRLPPRTRRQLHLPQQALDAAVVEHCVRWLRRPPPQRPAAAAAPQSPPDTDDDDYAHLPHTQHDTHRMLGSAGAGCGAVARGLAGTPLHLPPPPPRRRVLPPPAPPAAAAPAAAVDIMHMPIVFADDEPDAAGPKMASPEANRTMGKVEAGAAPRPLSFSKVIVAKRGAGRGRGAAAARGAGRGAGGARTPLLVRAVDAGGDDTRHAGRETGSNIRLL